PLLPLRLGGATNAVDVLEVGFDRREDVGRGRLRAHHVLGRAAPDVREGNGLVVGPCLRRRGSRCLVPSRRPLLLAGCGCPGLLLRCFGVLGLLLGRLVFFLLLFGFGGLGLFGLFLFLCLSVLRLSLLAVARRRVGADDGELGADVDGLAFLDEDLGQIPRR